MKKEDISFLAGKHREIFGEGDGVCLSRAPGRINLIGEHTDYNDGLCLPIAIGRHICAVGRARNDNLVRLYSLNHSSALSFPLDEMEREGTWGDYAKGVISVLLGRGCRIKGLDVLLYGDIPEGAGLSSSAALEVSCALLLQQLFDIQIGKRDLALLCQEAENAFVGVQCGIMDQFASCLCEEGKALFIDCASLEYRQVRIPLQGHEFVIADSKVKRELASSEYNRRRSECEESVQIIRRRLPSITSLRELTPEGLKQVGEVLPPHLAPRCRHVVSENERVLQGLECLEKGDLDGFGRLMVLSHRSLQRDYEVSSPELDVLVDAALDCEGCLGSRMTGAGFGGCTISLVKKEAVPLFRQKVAPAYEKAFGLQCEFYATSPRGGADFLWI